MENGKIHIYTGNGKGKTTAALGLSLRAAAYGMKTYIGQFMKGQEYGELVMSKDLPWLTIEQFGKDTFVHVKNPPNKEDVALARKGLEKCHLVLKEDIYDIVVLDEICVAHYFNLLTIDEILNVLKDKPNRTELILTGRYAPKELIDEADLVTEMKEVKHYYSQVVLARKGIEK
jgi:cob(I)alamin adenosyltransferase